MSIATKTGDAGETALMYGRRGPKMHRRVEAYGAVDELNAALGLFRATADHPIIQEKVYVVQKELVVFVGAVRRERQGRYGLASNFGHDGCTFRGGMDTQIRWAERKILRLRIRGGCRIVTDSSRNAKRVV